MTHKSKPPADIIDRLPPPPDAAGLGELFTILVKAWKHPDATGRKRKNSDLAHQAGISARTLQNLCRSRSDRPHSETYRGLVHALLGDDETRRPDWHAALAAAYQRITSDPEASFNTTSRTEAPINGAPPPSSSAGTFVQVLSTASNFRSKVPRHFCGRDRLLGHIRQKLIEAPSPVAIIGPHGIGKTALAAVYASSNQQVYTTVSWIDAETSAACIAALAAIGRRAGVATTSDSERDAVTRTLEMLRTSGEGQLLIYDNAPNPAVLASLLPEGSAHVLITSTHAHWRSIATPQFVPILDVEPAAAFLMARAGIFTGKPVARALAEDLGGFPIALEFAGAYCERHGLTLAQYRTRFSERPFSALYDRTLETPGYPRFTPDAFAASIAAVTKNSPSSLTILKILSALSPHDIPIDVLFEIIYEYGRSDGTPVDCHTLENALAALRASSLVRMPLIVINDRDNRASSMSGLIASIVQTAYGRLPNILSIVAETCIGKCPLLPIERLYARTPLKPVLMHLVNSPDLAHQGSLKARLHSRLAAGYEHNTTNEKAQYHARLGYRGAKLHCGPDSIEFADALQILGRNLNNRFYRRALIAFQHAEKILLRHHPEWHPRVADIRILLARLHTRKHYRSGAEELYAQVISLRHQTWPQNHEACAIVLWEFAQLSHTAKDYQDRMPLLAEALAIFCAAEEYPVLVFFHIRSALNKSLCHFPEPVFALKRFDEICIALTKQRAFSPLARALMHLQIGLLYLEHDLHRLANVNLESCFSLLPERSRWRVIALKHIAGYLKGEKKIQPLSTGLKLAVELEYSESDLADDLAEALLRDGRREEAAAIKRKYRLM
jgi:hypothetical protein